MAVSAFNRRDSGDHVVHVFEGSGAMWNAVSVVAGGFGRPGSAHGQLREPCGLRFTGDGTGLVVVDRGNGRLSLFRVEDWSFARHIATGLTYPLDVEVCEGGWLVACCHSHTTIEFVGCDVDNGVGAVTLKRYGKQDKDICFAFALALVPHLGLVVRSFNVRGFKAGLLQLFTTPDAVAMASMTAVRVGWMVAVAHSAVQGS